MKKSQKIKIFIGLFLLVFNISGICSNFLAYLNMNIESKEVLITENVQRYYRDGDALYTYWIKYDDYNGEVGILYTDSNGNNLKKGDITMVYRNVNSPSADSSDSTHGWHLSYESASRYDLLGTIIFSILTIINIVFLYNLLKKVILLRKKEKVSK